MAKEIKTIGVLTSGGDAPGMNAAVRATASGDVTRKSEQIGCGAVKRPLHRGAVRLHLIAAKRPPVKGYVQQQLLLHLCPPLQPDIV